MKNIIKENPPASQAPRLSEVSERDKKWDHHRGNTEKISRIYADKPAKFGKLADRMRQCANFLRFAWLNNADTGESTLKLRTAMFCKVRHCPVCAWRRGLRNVARFFTKLPELAAAFPKHRWLFLTLTVKNIPLEQLRAEIAAMNTAWKRLIQRQDWPADGWIRTVEVTRAKDGKAHPHFHVMLMVPAGYFARGYLNQKEWAQLWREAGRLDYDPVVNVKVVKPKVEGQTLQAAIVETLKYGTKVEDGLMSADWLYGITTQLHKMRFLASGGALAGILKEQMTDKEMVMGDDPEGGDGGEKQVLFKWQRKELVYRRHGAL